MDTFYCEVRSSHKLQRSFFLFMIAVLYIAGLTTLAQDAPGIPTDFSAEKQTNGIRLSWTAPEGGTDGYRILRRRPQLGEETLKKLVENTGSSATSYTDSNVAVEDEEYIYRVLALLNGEKSKRSAKLVVEVSPGDFGTSVEPPPTAVPPTAIPPTAVPPTASPLPPSNTPVLANSRIIESVSVTSNQAGVLEVSWSAPAETPHDYRVNWAKVGESYPARTDHSGNAFPASAGYSISGLEQDVRYKVKVRARYNGSAGPWTAESTALVMAAPRAAAIAKVAAATATQASELLRSENNQIVEPSTATPTATLAYASAHGDAQPPGEVVITSGRDYIGVTLMAFGTRAAKHKVFWRRQGSGSYQSSEFMAIITGLVAADRHYNIRNLSVNATYEVYVQAYNSHDEPGDETAIRTVRTLDLTVSGVRVTPGVNSLTVSWNAFSDQVMFSIYWGRADRIHGDERSSASGVTANSYTITDLIGGERYYVLLSAFHFEGISGEISQKYYGTTTGASSAPGRPGTPQIEEIGPAGTPLEVTWTKPSDGSSAITQYELRYCVGDCEYNQHKVLIPPTDGSGNQLTTITVSLNLGRIKTILASVRARNDSGFGSWSSERSFQLETTIDFETEGNPPGAPGRPVLAILDGDTINPIVTVSWAGATADNKNPVQYYQIHYTTHLDSVGRYFSVDVDTLVIDNLAVRFLSLHTRTSYYIRVRAENLTGYGSWSPTESIYLPDIDNNLVPLPTPTATLVPYVPGPPTDLAGWATTGVFDRSYVSVWWDASDFDGNREISHYILRYRALGEEWTERIVGTIFGMKFYSPDVVNSTTYEYQVAAVNEIGQSNWTRSLYLTPLKPPHAPDEPTLTSGNARIQVSWTPPNSNDSSITHYQLSYAEVDGSNYMLIERITNTSYTIQGLTNDTEYKVTIRAVSAAGEGNWSVWTNAAVPTAS